MAKEKTDAPWVITPKGWWLNVTVMARYQDLFIVGVLRKGKASWITEEVKGHFDNPKDAYDWGLNFIKEYKERPKL